MTPNSNLSRQRGAATLVVVMVLFFIISLVAAYTSRNMIFEQRTSANQYRSTQALEAAEAGMEWALTQLNFGRISDTCTPSTNTADTTFRQRYLNIEPSTGKILARVISPAPTLPASAELTPQCVFDPNAPAPTWNCSCPVNSAPVLAPPSGAAVAPAFRIRFVRIDPASALAPAQPNVVRAEVVGCTRLDSDCLNFVGQGQANEGRVVVSSLIALTGNVASTPLAALTARGAVVLSGGAVSVYNGAAGSLGLTVQSGGAIDAGVVVQTTAGTPASTSLVPNDPALNLVAAAPYSISDRMFASVFSMFPESFRQQQGGVQKTCGTGCLTGAASNIGDVRNLIALNPGRPLWLTGSLTVDTPGDIGSATEPVLLVVNGDVQFTSNAAGATIHGLVYVRKATDWATGGSGQISGAVVAESGVSVGAGTTLGIGYSGDTLNILRGNTGTFVRVPSSWTDFQ